MTEHSGNASCGFQYTTRFDHEQRRGRSRRTATGAIRMRLTAAAAPIAGGQHPQNVLGPIAPDPGRYRAEYLPGTDGSSIGADPMRSAETITCALRPIRWKPVLPIRTTNRKLLLKLSVVQGANSVRGRDKRSRTEAIEARF